MPAGARLRNRDGTASFATQVEWPWLVSIRAQFRMDMAELSVVHSCFNADQCEGPPTEASAAAPPPR
jgi:hypothetical protein